MGTEEKHASTRRGRRARERGQSTVEFALTLPIIIMLLLGLMEVGHGVNTYMTILASARDAARLGSQGLALDPALQALVSKETERLPNAVPVETDICDTPDVPGMCIDCSDAHSVSAVRVRVCYNHDLIVGLPGLLPNPWLICSQTRMRVVDF